MEDTRPSSLPLGTKDAQGRDLHLVHLRSFATLHPSSLPKTPFVAFVAADAREVPGADLLAFATALLEAGAVYAVCWGPSCTSLEDAFDYAAIAREPNASDHNVIMTTSHPEEPLEEALAFLSSAAQPAPAYLSTCQCTLLVLVGSVVSPSELTKELGSGSGAAG